jgi:hypothetical protein
MNRFVIAALVALPLAATATAGCTSEAPPPGPDPVITDPSKLGAPLSGQGFQFRTELFPVDANTEVQDCYFFKVRDLARQGGLPENEPVNLHRIEIVQRDGSHHMNIMRVKTIVGLDPNKGAIQRGKNAQGECFKSPNWADWPLVANTQQKGELDWTYPEGVANVFEPDEWLMLQTHYVNASSQRTPEGGEVAVNFHTIKKEEVKAKLGTIFATKQSIRVCKSNPTPTFTGSCQIKSAQPVNIIGANGHFHGRGKTFEMFSWDGKSIDRPADSAKFYQSQTWDEPPMLRSPDLNVQLPAGGGIMYSCTYGWTPPSEAIGGCAALDAFDKTKPAHKDLPPDCCYTFGGEVERNEHCNAFVYYYPKQDDVFCN